MAIVFHCEHCGKEIKAPDNYGGKWGKCPKCHNRVYIPSPEDEDELKLAPVDTNEVAREKQLMEETYRLTQDILREREIAESDITPPSAGSKDESKLETSIIQYLVLMSNGELDEAERLIPQINVFKAQAGKIIDQLASDSNEPELAQINPQVLAGMIRTLRSKIGR